MTARRDAGSRACTKADGASRLRQAELWVEMADLALAGETPGPTERTVAAGCAVLAGIAAADAICCAVTGTRYRGSDHRQAADFLETVTGDQGLGKKLRDLVDLKDAGHYGLHDVAPDKARMTVRRASALVDEARARLAGLTGAVQP
jgi:hypothetical protein